MTHAEWLTLVLERAPGLRAAGVHRISIGGASFTLRAAPPPEGPAVIDQGAPRDEGRLNALDDPETFGGVLPGYQLPASPPMPTEGDA